MMRKNKRLRFLFGCLSAFLILNSNFKSISVEIGESADTIDIYENKLLSYKFKNYSYKPYIKELFTPSGKNVLLDSPSDHLHHHGLMLAFNVDGINFWEENKNCGKQFQVNINKEQEHTEDKIKHCITGVLTWAVPDGEKLLIEERKIEIEMSKEFNATVLTWMSSFESLKNMQVEIGGAHYHGLGMRIARSMDEAGRFLNAYNKTGTVFRGDERLVESRWCAYISKVNGRTITVAMFDHPDNPRPATWFTMKEPFAYLSATMAVHNEPLILKSGQKLPLRYGVALWDGQIDSQIIEKLYSHWLESQKKIKEDKNVTK